MISELRPTEKTLKLIDECLTNGQLNTAQVSERLDCSQRHARRIMKDLADMNHEIGFIDVKYIKGGLGVLSKIEINLSI